MKPEGFNNSKNMHLATDYRFFGIPQPVSSSENQAFRQFFALWKQKN
jgi:hypothetical protein